MELQEAHRHAHRVRVVARVQRQALLPDVSCPRGVREAAFHVAAGLEESRDGWSRRIVGKRGRRRLEGDTATAPPRLWAVAGRRPGCRGASAGRRRSGAGRPGLATLTLAPGTAAAGGGA